MIQSLTTVLGTNNVLIQICQALQKSLTPFQQNPNHWQGLEACLYCIRSIARMVSNTEGHLMPKVMAVIPQICGNHHLRYTGTLIVGRYSSWVNQHPDTLSDALTFVIQGLNHPETASSAALSFKFLCEGCTHHLLQPHYLDNIFNLYSNSHLLTLPDQLEVTEGLCQCVSALPPDKVLEASMQLVMPLGKVLQESVTDNAKDTSAMKVALDKLAHFFRTLNPRANQEPEVVRSACVEIMKKLWVLFDKIIEKFKEPGYDAEMEKLCRCWKYGMRKSLQHFAPLLPQLLTSLVNVFKVSPRSCFMYTVSVCVDSFHSYTEVQGLLQSVYTSFVEKTLTLLQDKNSFIEQPEIVEDFFDMVTRFLIRYPEFVMRSPSLIEVWTCGLKGCTLEHKQSFVAVISFYREVVLQKNNGACNDMTKQILQSPYGQPLIDNMFMGLSGEVVETRVKYIITLLMTCKQSCPEVSTQLFVNALQKLPAVHGPTKEEFLQVFFSSDQARAQKNICQDLSEAYRRKKYAKVQ